jgi:hypothetical protein
MTAFVEECRQEWRRLGVPDLLADDMATELETDPRFPSPRHPVGHRGRRALRDDERGHFWTLARTRHGHPRRAVRPSPEPRRAEGVSGQADRRGGRLVVHGVPRSRCDAIVVGQTPGAGQVIRPNGTLTLRLRRG